MLERQVPDRESLKFRITGGDAAFVFMIELAEAGSHLSAAGSGRRHDHELAAGFNVVVFAETVVRNDQRDVRGIIRDDVMAVNGNTENFQALDEFVGG